LGLKNGTGGNKVECPLCSPAVNQHLIWVDPKSGSESPDHLLIAERTPNYDILPDHDCPAFHATRAASIASWEGKSVHSTFLNQKMDKEKSKPLNPPIAITITRRPMH